MTKLDHLTCVVVGVLLGLLVLTWAANANAYDAPVAWQTSALATAQRVWHPACGQLSLTLSDPAKSGLTVVDDAVGDPSYGQAIPFDQVVGFTVAHDCHLHLTSVSVDWRMMGYPYFCTITLHEAGRGAGMPGTNGPGVMNIRPSVSEVDDYVRHDGWIYQVAHYQGADRRCYRPQDKPHVINKWRIG